MEIHSDNIRQLIQLQFILNPQICEKVWKTDLGNHMWEKFIRVDRNLLIWLNSMDTYTQETLFRKLKTLIK
jgi:hypothetical protein